MNINEEILFDNMFLSINDSGEFIASGISSLLELLELPPVAAGLIRSKLLKIPEFVEEVDRRKKEKDSPEKIKNILHEKLLEIMNTTESDSDSLKAISILIDLHGLKPERKKEIKVDVGIEKRIESAMKRLEGEGWSLKN